MTVPALAPSCWNDALPELTAIPEAEVRDALRDSTVLQVPAGETLFHVGSECASYIVVIVGDIRVQVVGDNGRTAVLYHVRDAESCALTTMTLLGHSRYPAEAVTDQPTTLLSMPKAAFECAVDASPGMRALVFRDLSQRFAHAIARMQQVAFGSVERRLVRALLQLQCDGVVNVTHDQLAAEAGSVREVVSRHLKRYAGLGWVRLQRGRVELLDHAALTRFALLTT